MINHGSASAPRCSALSKALAMLEHRFTPPASKHCFVHVAEVMARGQIFVMFDSCFFIMGMKQKERVH
jgi:hypothetical protein